MELIVISFYFVSYNLDTREIQITDLKKNELQISGFS